METIEKSVEVLNDLVLINNDRIEGYERAISETKEGDGDLKLLFGSMLQESRQYRQELIAEVTRLGGNPESGTTNSGKIYRAWMDIKATFTGNDRKAILSNCEFGEDAAQKAYREALADESLSGDPRRLVAEQQQLLKISHDKIRALRDLQD